MPEGEEEGFLKRFEVTELVESSASILALVGNCDKVFSMGEVPRVQGD